MSCFQSQVLCRVFLQPLGFFKDSKNLRAKGWRAQSPKGFGESMCSDQILGNDFVHPKLRDEVTYFKFL